MQLQLTLSTQSKRCGKCHELVPLSEFSKDRSKWDGLFVWCKSCSRAQAKAHWESDSAVRIAHRESVRRFKQRAAGEIPAFQSKSTYTGRLPGTEGDTCHTAKRKKNRLATRTFCLEIKKYFSCQLCGERFPDCLDFHHIDPQEKSFSISDAVNKRRSVQSIVPEMVKCVCLCSNCHRKVHAGVESIDGLQPISIRHLTDAIRAMETQHNKAGGPLSTEANQSRDKG